MSIAHLLEDFSSVSSGQSISITDVSLEEHRLQGFENGYKAGWEDAVKAANDEASRISSDFAGNLQDISFTLQEAQLGILAAMRPLLSGMVNTVLPQLARQSLGLRVLDTLEGMARAVADGPVEIVTAPGNIDALQALIDERNIADVRLTGEPTMGEGQVHVRAAGSEQEIDLDAVLGQIETAVNDFFEDKQKDIA
ncbi:flagellar biosynthesis protein [Pelagivirga sediminicola]|uniref:Flagellar biosynthesis protein n=1 Tax=Pelagivirga sediminicola TaxID=2170575 RepID=A0A2T7G5H2_9RHOB|nr:flagellar biosynthesis protein [Pelagivirga sediminicola]PVA09659.1 flagellar biosynthesis protein [Pelagivirga sediminicola]